VSHLSDMATNRQLGLADARAFSRSGFAKLDISRACREDDAGKQQQFINLINPSTKQGLAFFSKSVEVVQVRISVQAFAGQSGGV
jgi:hypothetical protein